MRTSEPGWLKRWMQPSGRSSLKQAQLTQLGYFPGVSPPPNPGAIPIHYMSKALATTV